MSLWDDIEDDIKDDSRDEKFDFRNTELISTTNELRNQVDNLLDSVRTSL